MKIDYVSDIHINHYVPFKENQQKWEKHTRQWANDLFKTKVGEVLAIAGDFSEWNRQALWFLEEAAKVYEQVFFVTGNHDYYLLTKNRKRKYPDSKARQLDLINRAAEIPNVKPLCREVVNHKGKVITGDSLCYLPVTPEDWAFFVNVSNDSNYIFVSAAYEYGFSTKKDETRYLYKEAMEWYESLKKEKIDLMISHIPPLHPPISTYERNACYDCPVPFLVAPQWICGHQHIQGEFEKAGTRFWMNAIGYPDEKNEITLKTIEI